MKAKTKQPERPSAVDAAPVQHPLSRKERRRAERMSRKGANKGKRSSKHYLQPSFSCSSSAPTPAGASHSSPATTERQGEEGSRSGSVGAKALWQKRFDSSPSPSSSSFSHPSSRKRPTAAAATERGNEKKKKRRAEGEAPKTKKKTVARLSSTSSSATAQQDRLLIRQEDEEIRRLEAKLGIGVKGGSNRTKLVKEYRSEGYGDDFVDFLDSLDRILDARSDIDDDDDDDVGSDNRSNESDHDEDDDDDSRSDASLDEIDDEEEDDDDDNSAGSMSDHSEDGVKEEEGEEKADSTSDDGDGQLNQGQSSDEDEASQSDDGSNQSAGGADEEAKDDEGGTRNAPDDGTYRPAKGQDIYGNELLASKRVEKPAAYVPPHLRRQNNTSSKSQNANDNDDYKATDPQQVRLVQMELNRALNRLSEDTIVPTVNSICHIYSNHPNTVVNACLWNAVRQACVVTHSHMVMVKLVPMYAAAIAGVHSRMGDSAQLGEHCMETIVVELWESLEESPADKSRSHGVDNENSDDPEIDSADKTPHNLLLLLGYLYNYGVVHCTLLYDIVRRLIEGFPAPLEVELLLLVLGHCGRALRSDDPSALKDIVLSVQKSKHRDAATASKSVAATSSSRVEYMIEAMMDLKNNKKRRQDSAVAERTAKIRKLLGQVKRSVESGGGNASPSSSSLRITLEDILNADSRGRWWKVGASWVGNQFRYQSGDGTVDNGARASDRNRSASKSQSLVSAPNSSSTATADEKLLALATKFRMNTDLRRSIFCVIMGSADCDDAFEKLVRGEMLKPRNEREAARVLMECCGGERSFNKFYAHLAHRMCDFQPQCRFSFQLAFWDAFKRFDDMKIRKVANLAKLLFQLVVVHRTLKLNVLKPIDMASPNDLAEPALIFLTIFFTHLMQHFEDASQVTELFTSGIASKKRKRRNNRRGTAGDDDDQESADDDNSDDDENGSTDKLDAMDEGDALRASMLVFFVQVLKSSPDYAPKDGMFRRNLKAAIQACDVDSFF